MFKGVQLHGPSFREPDSDSLVTKSILEGYTCVFCSFC